MQLLKAGLRLSKQIFRLDPSGQTTTFMYCPNWFGKLDIQSFQAGFPLAHYRICIQNLPYHNPPKPLQKHKGKPMTRW